jgi:hypothetical protein
MFEFGQDNQGLQLSSAVQRENHSKLGRYLLMWLLDICEDQAEARLTMFQP